MPLVFKGLTSCLYAVGPIKAVNYNIIKALIIYIDAAGQCFIYNNKVIFHWDHTSSDNCLVYAHLFRRHRFIFITRRMDFYGVEAAFACNSNNTTIRFYKRRIAPVAVSWLWDQLTHVV